MNDTETQSATQKSRISDSEGKQKALEVRVVQLEELLNATKEEKETVKRESIVLHSEIEKLRKEQGEKPKAIEKEEPDRLELEAGHAQSGASFNMFDSSAFCAIITE
eukprot:209350_1